MSGRFDTQSAPGNDQRGVTLIELMIVVALIAILASYAYPGYQRFVAETNRAEGQAFLLDLMSRQQRYFSENNTYTADPADLGLAANPDGSVDAPGGNYSVTMAACDADGLTACVQLVAAARNRQLAAQDGDLLLDSRNQRTRTLPDGTRYDWQDHPLN